MAEIHSSTSHFCADVALVAVHQLHDRRPINVCSTESETFGVTSGTRQICELSIDVGVAWTAEDVRTFPPARPRHDKLCTLYALYTIAPQIVVDKCLDASSESNYAVEMLMVNADM